MKKLFPKKISDQFFPQNKQNFQLYHIWIRLHPLKFFTVHCALQLNGTFEKITCIYQKRTRNCMISYVVISKRTTSKNIILKTFLHSSGKWLTSQKKTKYTFKINMKESNEMMNFIGLKDQKRFFLKKHHKTTFW